jgi:hypothetical protein
MKPNLAKLLAYVAVVSGCEPVFQHRVNDPRLAPEQIVALPIVTVPHQMDSFDNRVEKQAWADAMEGFMTPVLERFVTGCGGRLVDQNEFEKCGTPCARLSGWASVAGLEVAAQKLGRAEIRRRAVDEWVYAADVTPAQKALAAKVALVVAFKDTPDTNKVGAACLTDLVDGRMIWCEARVDSPGVLGNVAGARHAIAELVRPIFSSLGPTCEPAPAPAP